MEPAAPKVHPPPIPRPDWVRRVEEAWERAPIVWLAGVRRAGKTTLARSVPGTAVFNCDLPSTAARLADPEHFFRHAPARRIVLDEVHQLADPSRVLKIAADAFPALRVLATGSSTLAATARFRDTLAGRKRVVHLCPVLGTEIEAFGVDLYRRLLHGGLPAELLRVRPDPEAYAEWLDSFFARDIQQLFRIDKRAGFLGLVRLLLRQSGGLAEASGLASDAGISRPTVRTYLDALETTYVIDRLRPFHGDSKQELVSQPKIYAFDTGFVCWARGWTDLRPEDCGLLWEHLVLDVLRTIPALPIHYWRDKRQREVDFVIPAARSTQHAVECKWSERGFDPAGLRAFRALHPHGRNFVCVPSAAAPYPRRFGDLDVTITPLGDLAVLLARD
jgi:hypothetical protein